jgi:hypothetical protein
MDNEDLIAAFVGACPKTACVPACYAFVNEIDEAATDQTWLNNFKSSCEPAGSQTSSSSSSSSSSASSSEEDENLNNSTLPDGQPKDEKGDSGISSMKIASSLLLISLMIANFQF